MQLFLIHLHDWKFKKKTNFLICITYLKIQENPVCQINVFKYFKN